MYILTGLIHYLFLNVDAALQGVCCDNKRHWNYFLHSSVFIECHIAESTIYHHRMINNRIQFKMTFNIILRYSEEMSFLKHQICCAFVDKLSMRVCINPHCLSLAYLNHGSWRNFKAVCPLIAIILPAKYFVHIIMGTGLLR